MRDFQGAKIEFFLYMKDLHKYNNQIYINTNNEHFGIQQLKQLSELDNDIFYFEFQLNSQQLIPSIKYHYSIAEQVITGTISRDLNKFRMDQSQYQNIIKIFDVPYSFYEKKSLVGQIFSQSNQILTQQSNHLQNLLSFVKSNSSQEMLIGLKNFIEKTENKQKEEILFHLSEKLYLQLSNYNLGELDYIFLDQRIKIFSSGFLKQKAKRIYEQLMSFYESKNINIQNLKTEQIDLIHLLSKYFSFNQWIQIFQQKKLFLFSSERILKGMKDILENSTKDEFEQALSSIKKLQLEKIQDDRINQELQIIIKRFWKLYYDITKNDNEKMNFFLTNSQYLISLFSNDRNILNDMVENYLKIMINDKNFDKFFENSTQFLDLYDKDGSIVKKVLSDYSFQKLKVKNQIKIYNLLPDRKINIQINLQPFLERILSHENNIHIIQSTLKLMISVDPFIQIKDPLYNHFCNYLKNQNRLDAFNYLEHKQIYLALITEQCQMQIQYPNSVIKQSNKITKQDIYNFEEQLDGILVKKLTSFNVEDILEKIDLFQQLLNLEKVKQLFEKIFTLKLENHANDNQIFLKSYDLVYHKYFQLDQNNNLNSKQIYQLILEQYEKFAINKYQQKSIRMNIFDDFTYSFLQRQSEYFKQQVLEDLQIFIDDKSISELDIETMNKLFSCQNFENIFNFFYDDKESFQNFRQKYMDKINFYKKEKLKIEKFFLRTKSYFEKEYQYFIMNSNENQQLGKLKDFINSFSHIQILYEFYNQFINSLIFQKMFALVENKYKMNSEQKDNINNIFAYLKQNLISFIYLLTQDTYNLYLLSEYQIKNSDSPIEKHNEQINLHENMNGQDENFKQNENNSSIQSQLFESQINLFENQKITIKILRQFTGVNYTESQQNISEFLQISQAHYLQADIENLIKNTYLNEFLYKQGKSILSLSEQFKIDLNNKENKNFYLSLQSLVENKQFENQCIHQCNSVKYFISSKLQQIILFSDYQINNLSLNLIGKLDEIIKYMLNNLKNSNFLDLRDLVDEDDTDVISLLIKLNNLSFIFQKLIELRNELQGKSSYEEMILEIIQFNNKYLAHSQTCLDIEECINNFYKISNISRTLDKNKMQYISLACQIIKEGTITFKIDNNNQDSKFQVHIHIVCNEEYGEEEIRSVCSKVILEQNTTTNSLKAAALNDMKKNPQRIQQLSYQEKPNVFQSKKEQFDDYFINLNHQQERQEEQLQEHIQEIKSKMQKFRDQWFIVEQIKDSIQELIKYGFCEIKKKKFSYDNRNNQYDQAYQQMQENYQSIKKNIENWKQHLEVVYYKYPWFTIIGISHYQQLRDYFSNSDKFTSDLLAQLKFIGNQEVQVYQQFSEKVDKDNFINLNENEQIELIAKICTANSKNFASKYEQRDIESHNGNKIFQIRYTGKKELIQILMSKIQYSQEQKQFYQYFFYNQQTQIQELELFLQRYKYLVTSTEGDEYFIIIQEQLDPKFLSMTIQILINLIKDQNKIRNKLYILIKQDILVGDISIIPCLQERNIIPQVNNMAGFSKQFIIDKSRVQIIFSDHPGSGKSLYIQQQQREDIIKGQMIRIPTNGDGGKKFFLNDLRQKIIDLNYCLLKSIHIDLYENLDYDINVLLFELIFLKFISIHSEMLLDIDQNVTIYIEVSNTLNQEFLNSLQIKEYFTSEKIEFNIQRFQINNSNLSEKDKLNQFTCFKYLKAIQLTSSKKNYLDQNDLSQNVYNQNNNYQQEFISILQNYFLNKLLEKQIQPCFYQLKNFIQLFGSEMQKFENCNYVRIDVIQLQNQNKLLSQGIRTQIMLMSYNICFEVSINNIRKGFKNQNQFESLNKDRIIDNKAQSIQKFNNLMMSFLTFQEQKEPCITSFFLKKDDVPSAIQKLYEISKEKIMFFNEQHSPQTLVKWLIMLINQRIEKIYKDQSSADYENLQCPQLKKTVERIIIQKDNFFKIALIFMRIRSNSPVIIMGQSGIGKTALIEVMSQIMEAKFCTMTVHAGVSEKDIISFIKENLKILQPDRQTILFFDEVNTNKLIGGLFKEILVDRCLKGVQLPRNLIPIAAINPYKLKDVQINGGIKQNLVDKIKNTNLEYMVEPIPESMYSFIWNFDSLTKFDEFCYLKQMILDKHQIKSKKYDAFNEQELKLIYNTVNSSQDFIRVEMKCQSACSLRDVNRFTKLLFWFVKILKIFQEFGLNIEKLSTYSMCLSFYVNYCVRLPLYEQRKKFLEVCSQDLSITYTKIQEIIDKVQSFLIDQLEIPEGIVKNTALKQNVFTLFVSIMNKIPVVLIGPPGCSKTLSLRILIQSMKGQQSKKPFFQKFKALMQLFYQGHIQSTSERILEVFERAKQKQKKIEEQGEKKNYLSLVYMEEIGLAEISPHNPLKVLHSTLEKPTIAVACISNWPLDQSKMNRMLIVYRLNTNIEELEETIQCIQKQIIQNEENDYNSYLLNQNLISDSDRNQISQVYLNYLNLLKYEQPDFEQFHGLRDFYAMAKLLCYQQLEFIKSQIDQGYKSNVEPCLYDRIIQSFLRNFSGLKDNKTILIKSIKSVFKELPQQSFNKVSTDLQLIDQNLSEKSKYFISRNLMIITENPQYAAEYISRKLIMMKRSHKVLVGSNFRDDQSQKSSYQIINQIISCVESGIIVIIQNLDNIYQSLYEILNQNYRKFNGKDYCKISFGADSSNIEVSPNFKLILLATSSQIQRMDGPLLNRFEKHSFSEGMTISEKEKEKINIIMENLKSQNELFDFSNLQEVVQSLLIQQRELGNADIKITDFISMIYHLSSLNKCQKLLNDKNNFQYKQEYINSNYHFSLEEFIRNSIINKANNPKKQKLITIFSPSLCQYQLLQTNNLNITLSHIILSQLDSQQTFIEKINLFLRNNNTNQKKMNQSLTFKNQIQELNPYYQNKISMIQDIDKQNQKILLVIADLNFDSYDRINLIRQKISETLINVQTLQNGDHNFQVILTIKINDIFAVLPYSGEWEQYYIEDLFPLSFVDDQNIEKQFNVQNLLKNKGEQVQSMFKIKSLLHKFILLNENITNSFRKIQYKQINKENYQKQRLNELWNIFCKKSDKLKQFISLCIIIAEKKFNQILVQQEIQTIDDFITKIIYKRGYAQQTTSLANAIWNGFNDLLQQSFSLIIYELEINNLVFALSNGINNDHMIQYITQKIIKTFKLNLQQIDFEREIYKGEMDIQKFKQMKYELDQNSLDLSYPKSDKINSIIDGIISKVFTFSNSITVDKSQDEEKTVKFKEITSQIEISLTEIFKSQSDEIKEIQVFQDLIKDDYFTFRKKDISQQQIIIAECILNSPNYEYNHQDDFIHKVLKIIVFVNLYSYDLQKIEQIINIFSKILQIENILDNFKKHKQNKNIKEQITIRDFVYELVKEINTKIQPSHELFRVVKSKNINLQGDIQQLVQFIDEYILYNDKKILVIKQQLIILSIFLVDIIQDLNFPIKTLSFIDIQQIKNLDNEYIQELKSELQGFYKSSNLTSSMIQNGKQQSQIVIGEDKQQGDELKQINQNDNFFEEKWNEFVLEIALFSIKLNENKFSQELLRSLLQLLHNVESNYLKNRQVSNLPSQILIKFKIIISELVSCIDSIENLRDIFLTEYQNPFILDTKSTEYAYQVILSNEFQQQIIKKKEAKINENKIIDLLYNSKIQELSLIQKLIYFSIFRYAVEYIINTINNNLELGQIDKNLKNYFKNLQQPYLQLYVVKVFYYQYKLGDLMISKMKKSSYLQDCEWFQKYSQSFKGLLSSSFLSEEQIQCYQEYFENKNENLKKLFQEYFKKYLQYSQNIFRQIYNGNLKYEQYYPFMMNNNIYLFHRDSQNNTQLYQCNKCLEYIFSNACPNLQSKIPCQQCGVIIAKGNENTIQVLQNANKNQQQLEYIIQTNQWKGFYIRLEDDQINFKIDEGTVLDLRIFSILYYFSFLISYQQNNHYMQNIEMKVFDLKKQQETTKHTEKINKILRIHYEAEPSKFINDQLDIAYDHSFKILKTHYKMSDEEIPIILFKILDELLQDQTIKSIDSQQNRVDINTQLSNKIFQLIEKSKKAILETKSEIVDKVLEKDDLSIKNIDENYLRNLRATGLNVTHDFIQNHIQQNLNKNQQILKEFLDISKITYIENGLKTLIKFTQMMNYTFIKIFTKKKAQEITLLEALENNKMHPLYIYFVNNVIPVWEQIKEKELVFQIGCQEHNIESINVQTKLNHLVFTENKSYGYFPNVIELLINSQNNFINKIYELSQNENQIDLKKVSEQIKYQLYDPQFNKLKELPIQQIDTERNIIKTYNTDIYSQYFMCNIDYSKGFEYISDLNSLLQELVQKVLSGVVSINIESSQKFLFLSDINQIGLLTNIQIEQEKIPFQIKIELSKNLQNKQQMFELLTQISTVFQIFKSEKNQGNLSLKSSLDQLQIKIKVESIIDILQQLKLIHINDMITYLEELNMDNLVEFCNPLYKSPISDDVFEKAIQFIDQTVNAVNFKLALGRFILRCLSSEQEQISTNGNLFSQLFYVDIYEELWDQIENVEENYEKACSYNVTIGQAYDFYLRTNKYCSDQLKNFKPQNKKESNNLNSSTSYIIQNFSDKMFTSNLKDQYD